MVVKARPQPGHWAPLLVVAPQACRTKLALLPCSSYGSNSNSAHSTSWNVDLVEWQELHPSVLCEQQNDLELALQPNPQRRNPPELQGFSYANFALVLEKPPRPGAQ